MNTLQQKFTAQIESIVESHDGFDVTVSLTASNVGTWHLMHGWNLVADIAFDFQRGSCSMYIRDGWFADQIDAVPHFFEEELIADPPVFRIDEGQVKFYVVRVGDTDRLTSFFAMVNWMLEGYETIELDGNEMGDVTHPGDGGSVAPPAEPAAPPAIVLVATDKTGEALVFGPFATNDDAREFANSDLAMPPSLEVRTSVSIIITPEQHRA